MINRGLPVFTRSRCREGQKGLPHSLRPQIQMADPYSIKPRRAGDIATCYCNPAKAKTELGRKAKYCIDDMVRDSWNCQKTILMCMVSNIVTK